jgi:hypothetical protein
VLPLVVLGSFAACRRTLTEVGRRERDRGECFVCVRCVFVCCGVRSVRRRVRLFMCVCAFGCIFVCSKRVGAVVNILIRV